MARYANVDKLMEHAISLDWSVLKWVNDVDISTAINPNVVERKKGKWTEKQVIHADEAKEVVEEWQSCRCSICGHYNTQPYMYYFSEPNYCSFCGASMKEEATDAQLD